MSEQGGGKSGGNCCAYPWMVYRGLRHCWSDRGKVDSRSIETDGRARSPMGTCSRFPDHVRRTAIGALRTPMFNTAMSGSRHIAADRQRWAPHEREMVTCRSG